MTDFVDQTTGHRRVRALYVSLAALLVGATSVLALTVKPVSTALIALGVGSLTFAAIALMADADEDTPALVRTGHLTKAERRAIIIGVVGAAVAFVMMFVEAALGLSERETGILAATFATGAGLVAFLGLIRGDPS